MCAAPVRKRVHLLSVFAVTVVQVLCIAMTVDPMALATHCTPGRRICKCDSTCCLASAFILCSILAIAVRYSMSTDAMQFS